MRQGRGPRRLIECKQPSFEAKRWRNLPNTRLLSHLGACACKLAPLADAELRTTRSARCATRSAATFPGGLRPLRSLVAFPGSRLAEPATMGNWTCGSRRHALGPAASRRHALGAASPRWSPLAGRPGGTCSCGRGRSRCAHRCLPFPIALAEPAGLVALLLVVYCVMTSVSIWSP